MPKQGKRAARTSTDTRTTERTKACETKTNGAPKLETPGSCGVSRENATVSNLREADRAGRTRPGGGRSKLIGALDALAECLDPRRFGSLGARIGNIIADRAAIGLSNMRLMDSGMVATEVLLGHSGPGTLDDLLRLQYPPAPAFRIEGVQPLVEGAVRSAEQADMAIEKGAAAGLSVASGGTLSEPLLRCILSEAREALIRWFSGLSRATPFDTELPRKLVEWSDMFKRAGKLLTSMPARNPKGDAPGLLVVGTMHPDETPSLAFTRSAYAECHGKVAKALEVRNKRAREAGQKTICVATFYNHLLKLDKIYRGRQAWAG